LLTDPCCNFLAVIYAKAAIAAIATVPKTAPATIPPIEALDNPLESPEPIGVGVADADEIEEV
jgi:hypothetical protein